MSPLTFVLASILYPGFYHQALNCHFQVLSRAKQEIPHFNLLNLQEKI